LLIESIKSCIVLAIAIIDYVLSNQGLSKKGYKLTGLQRPEIRVGVVSKGPINKRPFFDSLAI